MMDGHRGWLKTLADNAKCKKEPRRQHSVSGWPVLPCINCICGHCQPLTSRALWEYSLQDIVML